MNKTQIGKNVEQDKYVQGINDMDILLTTADIISILKLCRRSVQAIRDSGKLTYYKVGGKILYRMIDVNKMLDKHKIQSF